MIAKLPAAFLNELHQYCRLARLPQESVEAAKHAFWHLHRGGAIEGAWEIIGSDQRVRDLLETAVKITA